MFKLWSWGGKWKFFPCKMKVQVWCLWLLCLDPPPLHGASSLGLHVTLYLFSKKANQFIKNICFKFKFLFVLFSVKPENVQLLTNVTANNTCPGGYWNFTCSVDAANPQVTSYHLLENDIAVDTSGSGMWIRTLSNSGEFIYKCLANNTVGSTISANEKKIIVAGNNLKFTSL